VETWTGFVAPRGTPPEIVRRLGAEVARILAEPEVSERFKALGFQPVASSSADMAALTRKELARFRDLVQRIGITAE
jgi:tripartite-type tricarboxylate transporter receptor subunit TctC